jgi:hypothetical protein
MTSEFITNKKSVSQISVLARLYVWSVLLHPLLFFYIAHEQSIGIGGNIAKFLELIVCLCVAFCFIFIRSYTIKINLNTSMYWVYFFYSIIVGFFGFFFGYYYIDGSIFSESPSQGFFNSREIRPIVEYVITIFYFFYFVILGGHFLSNDKIIDYFFKIFFFLFYANLILGYIDIFFTYYLNIDLIPISLVRDSGTLYRFHGLSGEPRDAFVYLLFGIGMLYLYDAWKMQKKHRPILISLSILATMLTASVSGIIGMVIASFLFIIYVISTRNFKNILLVFMAISILAIVIYLNLLYFDRYEKYLKELPIFFTSLISNSDTSNSIFYGQLPNIYPLFSRFLELSEMNILPTLFGTGIGSESVINVNMSDAPDAVLNPHSQVVRLFYSSGIIGSVIYVMAFYLPVYKISKIYKSKVFIYLTLLILGASLGHRSVVIFIFLGAFLAIFKQLSNNQKT